VIFVNDIGQGTDLPMGEARALPGKLGGESVLDA